MNFIRSNARELRLLLTLFVCFIVINPAVQWLFPTAGALDWSFLTLIVAGLFKAVLICVGVWLMIAVFLPTVNRFLDGPEFRRAFENLAPAEKLRGACLAILTFTALLTVCVLWG